MRFILYTRVSTQEQGDSRNGLEAQLSALRRFLQSCQGEEVGHVEEVASGGYGLDRRPGLRQALAQARQARAVLLVSKLDRLSRSVEFVAALMNQGASFATVEDGLEVQPFQLHLKAMLAEHERRTIGERTRAALKALQARGQALGIASHKAPEVSGPKARAAASVAIKREADGFALHLAPVVLRMRSAGMTCAQMAAELNTQGNRTARGGQWHASTVHGVLKRLQALGVQG